MPLAAALGYVKAQPTTPWENIGVFAVPRTTHKKSPAGEA